LRQNCACVLGLRRNPIKNDHNELQLFVLTEFGYKRINDRGLLFTGFTGKTGYFRHA